VSIYKSRATPDHGVRRFFSTAFKAPVPPEGKAPSVLKAERTSVREHFDSPGNTALGCEVVPESNKTALKRQITPEGKAPGKLKAEHTSVCEHFDSPGNAALGCEMAL
jgi:hypothetical protein